MRPWRFVDFTEVLDALSAYLEVEAPIRPRTLYISTKLHGITFKKNAEFLVYSLNIDAKSERQIKCDPYRGLKDNCVAEKSLLLISGLTRLNLFVYLGFFR
jgi:hypothetical protein